MAVSFSAAAGLIGIGEIAPSRGLVRPPGAVSEAEFLQRCIRCGACADVCPVRGIGIAHLTGGVRNVGTPLLAGYCMLYKGLENPSPQTAMSWRTNARAHGEEVRCYDCINVCPTGALRQERANPPLMGTAVVLKEYCKAWKFGNCQFPCRDVCLFDAISISTGPVVDETKCVGCGQCDVVCLARLFGPTAIIVEPSQA
jgi:ferredoxin-type protein NapG